MRLTDSPFSWRSCCSRNDENVFPDSGSIEEATDDLWSASANKWLRRERAPRSVPAERRSIGTSFVSDDVSPVGSLAELPATSPPKVFVLNILLGEKRSGRLKTVAVGLITVDGC